MNLRPSENLRCATLVEMLGGARKQRMATARSALAILARAWIAAMDSGSRR
jgi:hypothetical protein